eukprot:COSAG02_NODE_2984_length_7618_cov_6.217981_5_plen_395_part_00
MGILPYATTAALSWPPLSNFAPTDVLLVLISVFALMPWAGLPPGLTPILVLWRLRGWVPHPWAAKKRTVLQTAVLVLVSPILIPAVFGAALLLFWPIHMDYMRYRESTGEQLGGTVAAAASVQRGEKHDWRKWLNTRWVETFGYTDVTDPKLDILTAAIQENPVSYLRMSVPRNKAKGGKETGTQRGRGPRESPHEEGEMTHILPQREGERPLMLRGQPHRQIDQLPPSINDPDWARLNAGLMASVFGTTSDHADASTADVKRMPWLIYPPQRTGCGVFRSVDSLYEGTGAKSLRFTPSSFCKCCDDVVDRKGEWAHVHRLDRSWHVLLSPADTAAVLQSGYGEIWPVAALGWVPVGYVLIYAPRNPEEIEVLLRILEASWMYCAHEWEGSGRE